MSSRRQATEAPSREEFTALDSARAKLDEDVAVVRRTVDSHSTDITEIKTSLRTVTSELSSLNSKFDQLMASFTPLPASQTPPNSGAPPTSSATATTTSSSSEQAASDKSSSEKSTAEKSTSEKPASDKPAWDSKAAAYPNSKTPSVRSQPTTITGVEETGRSFSVKPEELGSFDGTPEDATLFLANIEAIRTTERDPGWDKALLRALPRTLRGSARLWFASLSPVERSTSLGSLDALLTAIRANFKPAQAVVRQQARARRWQPDDEDVIHYTFVKAALLKTGWPDISEGEVVKEVIDGIDPAVAKLVQTPFRNDPTLVAVRTELRIQETFWRAEFGRPLVRPPPSSSVAGVPAFESLIKPAQHASSSVFVAQTGDSDTSVDAYPQTAQTSQHAFATRQPNPRQGRSIRSDFDPANLRYRIHPELNKRMMSYKVPLTNRIMWEKPGEPPPPTALLAQPAPERTAEGKGDWNYTLSDRCDPPSRHYTTAKGCKSDVERVAVSLGPEETLNIGYHTIPTPGPDRGHGPSSAQTTRGHPQGKYHTCPPNVTSDQSSTDDPSLPSRPATIDHQHPVLLLADHWLHHPATLPSAAVSPKRPRGEIKDVELCRLDETGSGLGHLRHAPTSCQIQFLNADLAPASCLVDTGASLSTIDAGLARRLGQVPSGGTLSINGIGTERTLGFITLPFAIEGTDEAGVAVRLHFSHDFHIVPAFGPGILLGQDWISGHGLSVDPAHDKASLQGYTFRVRSERPHAHTFHGKICTRQAVVLAPGHHSWVPVDTAALIDNVDYTLDPTWHFEPTNDQIAAAIPCVMDRQTSRVLVTNFGDEPLEVPSRTLLGEATACGPGTISTIQAHSFPLSTTTSTPPSTSPAPSTGSPLDPFEFDEQPLAARAQEDSTALVDDTFRVGLDEKGIPHAEIVALLRRHREAFSLDGRPGHVQGAAMTIPVPDPSKLQAEPPRRVSPEKRQAIDNELAQLLEWGVVEESSSPVSAPVHLVKQRTKLRFCVDYRSLNTATTPDRYPLPRVDDVIENLRGHSWFSSMDAVRGYHQADIDPADRWKTAFATHRGLFQYRRVPFGLKSAPAFFQRMMDALLGPIRWIAALVYLDDIVTYTHTLGEHLRALDYILSEAERVGLRFSPAKCTFAVRELTLLGRKVSGFGLGVMEDRVASVRALPRPRNLQDLYHTLGLFSYYRAFIPRYSQRAAPLTALTKGLAYKQVGNTWRLVRADGTATTKTAELLDWTDAQERAFQDLRDALIKPPTLAHPDYDRPFLLYTDACRTGFAAAIHQIHVHPVESSTAAFPVWPRLSPPLDPADWAAALQQDPTFGPTVRRLSGPSSRGDETYSLEDGILVRKDDGRVCVPRSKLLAVLRRAHDDGGHFGFGKTYALVATQFWHPRLSSLVAAYVRYCEPCLRTRKSRKTGALDVDQDATRPFQHTSVDVVLGMPSSRRRHDAYIIGVCTFSRMVVLEPCSSSFTAQDIVKFVMNRIVRLGWRPERLTSDHDTRIIGEAGRQLGEFLGVRITATPPHHHQANPVERHVQTVQRVLKAMSGDRPGLWDEEVLPAVELAVNSSFNTVTGMTPLDAVFIDSPRLVDALLRAPPHSGVGDWAERFRHARARLTEARTRIDAERRHQKVYFDARHRPLPTLRPGSLVWIRLTDRPVRSAPGGKLDPVKLGPFPVRRVLSPHRVLVEVPPHLNVGDEFDVAQLDVHPVGKDPFASDRVTTSSPSRAPVPLPATSPSDAAPTPASIRRGDRERRPAAVLRDPTYDVHTLRADLGSPLLDRGSDAFSTPVPRSKEIELEGVRVQVIERPVAFMSRTTTLAESKLAGPELELACLSWAFTRAQHMLEGAKVTVITDHAPIPGMLSSRPGAIPYGHAVERARVVLRPHLDNLRFVYRPGRLHVNVDALSRLVRDDPAPPRRRASFGGGM
ncbi:hypothetical protein CF326_g6849 [Tilletia indica]|nr:hypothetical protein CF326_g6849 [Tilletia indica]